MTGSVESSRCYVIAEAGVNHNGSEARAVKMVEVAAGAGADAVKFQTFRTDRLVKPKAGTAEYQRRATGSDNQYEMLKDLELSEEAHERLIERCLDLDIDFLSTPFDEESVDFLVSRGMKKIKIPSGEVTNLPLLRHIAAKSLPMILSTGMADLGEVEEAVETIRSVSGDMVDLVLLHCTSSYPTELEDVNLRAMVTMRDHFELRVGYSDHTLGTVVPAAAVAMGATVIEKHFTLDRELPGPDHRMSLTPEEVSQMIDNIRIVETIMGTGEKKPRASEIAVREVVRRSVTLRRPVRKGSVLTEEDVLLLRPGNGIPPAAIGDVVGRQAARDLEIWTTLQWSDLD